MADDQKNRDTDTPDTSSDLGQMGGQNPQTGQKGGQAQSDVGTDVGQGDFSQTESGMDEDTTSLGDEDL